MSRLQVKDRMRVPNATNQPLGTCSLAGCNIQFRCNLHGAELPGYTDLGACINLKREIYLNGLTHCGKLLSPNFPGKAVRLFSVPA